jgi:hypothetical protein
MSAPMRNTFALSVTAALIIGTPLVYSQDKESEEQIKQANEAAKKMGLKMPDMKELAEENDKEEAKEKATAQAAVDAKGPVALPDWMPKVPQFTPSGPATRELVDGQPKIVLTGTSPLAPDVLADAWEAFKSPKIGHERTGSDINHNVDLSMTLKNGEDGTEVKMESERKAGAKITHVTVSSPLPLPKEKDAASDDN